MHSVAIYDWAQNSKLCDSKVDGAAIYDANWSNDENQFAIVGAKCMKIFTQNGQNLIGKSAAISNLGQQQNTQVKYLFNNQLVTGTSTGQLILWSGG